MAYLVAIDPAALVLSSATYIRLTLPDPPPDAVLRQHLAELVKAMSTAERRIALARAKALNSYADAVQQAIAAAG